MRLLRRIRKQAWYPLAVAACIGVTLNAFLMRFDGFWGRLGSFIGYFTPVILGCIIAYLVNPLAQFFRRTLFRPIRHERLAVVLSNVLAFLAVVIFIVFALATLLPQLIDSVINFANNLDSYVASAKTLLESLEIPGLDAQLDAFVDSSEMLLNSVTGYVRSNLGTVLSFSANVGKTAFMWIVAFILAVYCLMAKSRQERGIKRLLRVAVSSRRYQELMVFFGRCNTILKRYIVYNLLESIIVGVANGVFMALMGMPYVGLVSIVVAVTNLVPTFGPVVGAVIGALILFLVRPWYVLAFLLFTLVLQFIDGYIIKPKLYGDSLGVSSLWILIAVIVSGRMFGILGILLAIPAIAILDFVYDEYLMPFLERRHQKMEAEN